MPRDESSQFRDATRTLQPGVDDTTMRRRPPVLTPGETFGRFRLIQLLGRGGMGEAYEGEDLKSGERVALKMSRDVLATEQQREQFLREGRVVAAISHPHLVYVVGTEEIQEIPVLVTELVTGSTLRARVAEGGPLPSIEAVDMILQVISGLAALAAHGVLHRDVKPSNCFVGPDGRVKVGDFGLAISTRPDATGTRTGDVVGTRAFASPEQLRAAPPDIRSDIYSVGATLHYLLTAREPHSEGEAPAVTVPSLDTRGPMPGVPRKLGKLVRQCLAQSPARRPQSYARLSTLLVPFSSAAQVPAAPGLRVLAGIIDMAVLRVGSVLPLLAVIQWNVPVTLFGMAAAHAILILGYFVLSETIWSASPGKLVLGLRVIRADRRPLGAGRVCVRAAVWCMATVPGFVAWLVFGPRGLGTVTSGAGALGYFAANAGLLTGFSLLFVTARRSNGFAGLHDLVTHTRVVSKLALAPRPSLQVIESRPPVASSATRFGPFVVLDEVSGAGVLVGFDPRLTRKVWIRQAPPGTPDVSSERRSVNRAARLRWLGGSRERDDGWDAYEPAPGQAISTPGRQGTEWSTVRGWLYELAQEFANASHTSGFGPLATERVWVTDDRVTLLDWSPFGDGGEPPALIDAADIRDAQRFLYDVAMLGLSLEASATKPPGRPPLPLHAQAFLADLASGRIPTIAAIVERLRAMATRPTTVTRARRGAHLALCGAAPLASLLLLAPVLLITLPLMARSPESFLIEASLRRLQQLEAPTTPAAMREREDIETYLVGRFRPLLTGQQTPWYWPVIEIRRPVIERAFAHQPNPSSDEIGLARRRLDGLVEAAERNRELAARGRLGWPLLLFVVVMLVAAAGVVSVVSAFLAKSGAGLRLLGIGVVNREGSEVSRGRAGARAAVAWATGIAAFLLLVPSAAQGRLLDVSLGTLLPSSILLVIFIAGAVSSLLDPQRGLQDRILRTSLVAR